MRCFSTILLFLVVSPAWSLKPAEDASLAVVRIKSHGGSGTIIKTTPGKSWILSCAHMFQGHDQRPSQSMLHKPLQIDGPMQPHAANLKAQARLIAHDFDLDLSLIVLDNGPFNFVPVAHADCRPGKNIWSLGYDEMRWPITRKRATILLSRDNTTYTQEKPWHGRSGGALIDADQRVLIGVVQGYEVWPTQRGLYVSHEAILRFLTRRLGDEPRLPNKPQQYSHPFLLRPFASPQPPC